MKLQFFHVRDNRKVIRHATQRIVEQNSPTTRLLDK